MVRSLPFVVLNDAARRHLTARLSGRSPVAAGLAGSFWVSIQTKITKFRMRYVTTRWRQFSEAVFICFLNTTIMVGDVPIVRTGIGGSCNRRIWWCGLPVVPTLVLLRPRVASGFQKTPTLSPPSTNFKSSVLGCDGGWPVHQLRR